MRILLRLRDSNDFVENLIYEGQENSNASKLLARNFLEGAPVRENTNKLGTDAWRVLRFAVVV